MIEKIEDWCIRGRNQPNETTFAKRMASETCLNWKLKLCTIAGEMEEWGWEKLNQSQDEERHRTPTIEMRSNFFILRISPIPGPPNTRMSSLEEPPLSLMGMT